MNNNLKFFFHFRRRDGRRSGTFGKISDDVENVLGFYRGNVRGGRFAELAHHRDAPLRRHESSRTRHDRADVQTDLKMSKAQQKAKISYQTAISHDSYQFDRGKNKNYSSLRSFFWNIKKKYV